MITIYSGPVSWFSRKVEIALRELGLPFEQVIVPFSQTRGYFDRPEAVVRINPKRQVPVLIDGAVELYDSTVIIEYLDEAYGPGRGVRLLPADPVARAMCRQFDLFADEVMLQPIRRLMHRTEPRDHGSAEWRELEAAAAGAIPEIAGHFDRLDRVLQSQPCLCGEFSVADIACFMAVLWTRRLAGPQFGSRAALHGWYRRLAARPAFRQAMDEIIDQDRRLSAPVAGAFAGD